MREVAKINPVSSSRRDIEFDSAARIPGVTMRPYRFIGETKLAWRRAPCV